MLAFSTHRPFEARRFKPIIVSGTFWFNAIEQTDGDTVHVTNGRFDMHYID
ncbi:MAG: hypothetical protein ABJB05_04415 [Parafilimonas sp.]